MFYVHTEDQLVEWTRQLQYFRYVREPREMDTLEAKWEYRNVDEIKQFSNHLGFDIKTYDVKPAQPVQGVSYRHLEQFVSLIPETTWWQQPGNVIIDGERVFINCSGGIVRMSISHGGGEVFAEQFESAIRLEKKLMTLKLPFIVPPVNRNYCFSKTTYPESFNRNSENSAKPKSTSLLSRLLRSKIP